MLETWVGALAWEVCYRMVWVGIYCPAEIWSEKKVAQDLKIILLN